MPTIVVVEKCDATQKVAGCRKHPTGLLNRITNEAMTNYVQTQLDAVASTDEQDPLGDVKREDNCPVCDGSGTHGAVPCFACLILDDQNEEARE